MPLVKADMLFKGETFKHIDSHFTTLSEPVISGVRGSERVSVYVENRKTKSRRTFQFPLGTKVLLIATRNIR